MVPTDPLRLWVPDSATEGTTQRANMQNALMGTQSCSDHSFENESIHQDFIMTLIHDLLKSNELPKACLFIQQIFITTQQSNQQQLYPLNHVTCTYQELCSVQTTQHPWKAWLVLP